MDRYLSFYRTAGIFSLAGFLLLGIGFLQPFSLTDSVNATDNADTGSQNVDVKVTLEPTLAISTDVDSVNINVSPDNYEDLLTSDVTVSVDTNNTYGYTLSIAAEGDETALVSSNNNNIKIPTLSAETTNTTWAEDNELNNTWGFTHNNTNLLTTGTYLPIPAANDNNETTIKTTSDPGSNSETKVTFATKIDASQLSGDYSNKIIFSAVANSEPQTMQNFTAAKCDALTEWGSDGSEGDTITLPDSRDDNKYQIRKLADGHCWMVTDLKIGNTIDTITLTPNNSDILSDWTLPTSINSDFYAMNTAQIHIDTSIIYGTYYNWNAATAGTGTTNITDGDASSSICPKKWKLPKGGNTTNYSWYNLYTRYNSDNSIFQNATNTGDNYKNGYFFSNTLHYQGYSGYWWSRTSSDSTEAHYLATSSGNSVIPLGHSRKDEGRAMRCILSNE